MDNSVWTRYVELFTAQQSGGIKQEDQRMQDGKYQLGKHQQGNST